MAVLLIARPIIVARFARVSLMKQEALPVIGETWLIVLGCGTGRARLLPYSQQIITDLQGFSLLLLRNPHLFENVAFFFGRTQVSFHCEHPRYLVDNTSPDSALCCFCLFPSVVEILPGR